MCHIKHPASPLHPDNINIFQGLFGIAFLFKDTTLIRCISSYEYGRCYGLRPTYNKPVYPKSANYNVLHDGCPGKTMLIILEHCVGCLLVCHDFMITTNLDDVSLPITHVATVFHFFK